MTGRFLAHKPHDVHMLGFRGHFGTKSRRYSITFGALRRARRRAQAPIAEHRATGTPLDLAALEADLLAEEDTQTTLVIGSWHYAGTGWNTEAQRVLGTAAPYAARVQSLRRLIADLDEEVDLFAPLTRGRLAANPDSVAVQQLPGGGAVLAAVFLAEVGDVGRFRTAPQLACWAGLTPKHHESDKHVHRGRITKQGSRLVRWAAVESVKALGPRTVVGDYKQQVADRRGKNIGTLAAARRQTEFVFYALRDHHVRALDHRPRPQRTAA